MLVCSLWILSLLDIRKSHYFHVFKIVFLDIKLWVSRFFSAFKDVTACYFLTRSPLFLTLFLCAVVPPCSWFAFCDCSNLVVNCARKYDVEKSRNL